MNCNRLKMVGTANQRVLCLTIGGLLAVYFSPFNQLSGPNLMRFAYPLTLLSLLLLLGDRLSHAESSPNIHDSPEMQVMTSIHPLGLIARAVLPEEIEVKTLLPASANPHFFTLRPSDIVRLNGSSLLFWVGPDMETFLPKILDNSSTFAVALGDPHTEEGQSNDKTVHQENIHDDHGHQNEDSHIWLDPQKSIESAQAIAVAVKTRLAEDSPLRPKIDSRLALFTTELNRLLEEYRPRFSALEGTEFYTRHDSLSRLSSVFGFTLIDSVSQTPEKKPGLAKVISLKAKMQQAKSACYLSESFVMDHYGKEFVAGSSIKTQTLDLTGSSIPLSQSGYLNFLTGLLDRLLACADPAE